MGVRSRVWLASAIPISVATAAAAAPARGPYVALGGGVDFLQNEQLPADPGIGSPSRVLHFVNPGVTGEGSVGWGFGNGFRIEIEGDYFNDHNRKISVPFDGPRRVGGFQQLYGGFLNALYDIPLLAPVTPYLGLGIGGQALSNNNYNTSVPGYAFGPSRPNHQVAGALAYQAIAGFSWPVAAVPGLSLTTEYRLVGLVDPLAAVHVQSTSQRLVIPSNPLPFFPRIRELRLLLALLLQLQSSVCRNRPHDRQPAFHQHLPPLGDLRPALRLQQRSPAAPCAAHAGGAAGAAAGAHVSRVLRLGPRDADPARPRDRRTTRRRARRACTSPRSRSTATPTPATRSPAHADTTTICNSRCTSCRRRARRARARRRGGRARSPCTATATRICWCPPDPTRASRRTGASRSCCGDFAGFCTHLWWVQGSSRDPSLSSSSCAPCSPHFSEPAAALVPGAPVARPRQRDRDPPRRDRPAQRGPVHAGGLEACGAAHRARAALPAARCVAHASRAGGGAAARLGRQLRRSAAGATGLPLAAQGDRRAGWSETYASRTDLGRSFIGRALHITETMFDADAYAALDALAHRPEIDAAHVALMGFSYGAMATQYAATRTIADRFSHAPASASRGSPAIMDRASRASTTCAPPARKLLMMYGGRDQLIDQGRCAAGGRTISAAAAARSP